jgi:hypothetical protein
MERWSLGALKTGGAGVPARVIDIAKCAKEAATGVAGSNGAVCRVGKAASFLAADDGFRQDGLGGR